MPKPLGWVWRMIIRRSSVVLKQIIKTLSVNCFSILWGRQRGITCIFQKFLLFTTTVFRGFISGVEHNLEIALIHFTNTPGVITFTYGLYMYKNSQCIEIRSWHCHIWQMVYLKLWLTTRFRWATHWCSCLFNVVWSSCINWFVKSYNLFLKIQNAVIKNLFVRHHFHNCIIMFLCLKYINFSARLS